MICGQPGDLGVDHWTTTGILRNVVVEFAREKTLKTVVRAQGRQGIVSHSKDQAAAITLYHAGPMTDGGCSTAQMIQDAAP